MKKPFCYRMIIELWAPNSGSWFFNLLPRHFPSDELYTHQYRYIIIVGSPIDAHRAEAVEAEHNGHPVADSATVDENQSAWCIEAKVLWMEEYT